MVHHPDENRQTVRMPFAQLRELVIALIDPPAPLGVVPEGSLDLDALAFEDEDDIDAEREFESQPTTYALNRPRVSTLDQLIAALR